jgi:hypothetical protein
LYLDNNLGINAEGYFFIFHIVVNNGGCRFKIPCLLL